mmetsp:Transcript_10107/g.15324  ORF Transcript_10107/g.15324 Transcript_10107/m.15324 type:complete len:95 (+) Transcript_10107:44-328(+)
MSRNIQFCFVVGLICLWTSLVQCKNEAETDIVYDEQTEHLDVMATVDISLYSFVAWNIFSVFAGMCVCCFIQVGYQSFADKVIVDEPPKKVTPY